MGHDHIKQNHRALAFQTKPLVLLWMHFSFQIIMQLHILDLICKNTYKITAQIYHGEYWQPLVQQDKYINQRANGASLEMILINKAAQTKTLWLRKLGILTLRTKNSIHLFLLALPSMLFGMEEWNLCCSGCFVQQNPFISQFSFMKENECLEPPYLNIARSLNI